MTDQRTEQLKEQIKHETELLRLSWITAAATAGGSIGLFLGEASLLRSGLAGLGLVLTLTLVAIGVRQDRYIRMLLRQILEDL